MYFSKRGKEPHFGNGSGVWKLITAKTKSILITITEISGRWKQIKLKPPEAMEKTVSQLFFIAFKPLKSTLKIVNKITPVI